MTTLKDKYAEQIRSVLDLFPEEELNLVRNRGHKMTIEQWWWGKRMMLWLRIALPSGAVRNQDQVYAAMSQMSGIPKRTLRYYKATVEFFADMEEEEMLEEYIEILPFSHFDVARSFGTASAIAVLDASMDYFGKYHKFCSAENLGFWFSRNAQPKLKKDEEFKHRAEMILSKLEEMPSTPEDEIMSTFTDLPEEQIKVSQVETRRWILDMDKVMSQLRRAIKGLPISPDAQTRLESAVDNMKDALEEALKEIL